MKYLETILSFLTTIARLLFRGKRKHKPDQPMADDPGNSGIDPPQQRGGTGGHRSDTIDLPKNTSSPENLMGWALIVCATGGYLLKLLG